MKLHHEYIRGMTRANGADPFRSMLKRGYHETFHALGGELTRMFIAHRLTTVWSCDVIHLMSEGRIVDSGAYDELMEGNATFRRMARVTP